MPPTNENDPLETLRRAESRRRAAQPNYQQPRSNRRNRGVKCKNLNTTAWIIVGCMQICLLSITAAITYQILKANSGTRSVGWEEPSLWWLVGSFVVLVTGMLVLMCMYWTGRCFPAQVTLQDRIRAEEEEEERILDLEITARRNQIRNEEGFQFVSGRHIAHEYSTVDAPAGTRGRALRETATPAPVHIFQSNNPYRSRRAPGVNRDGFELTPVYGGSERDPYNPPRYLPVGRTLTSPITPTAGASNRGRRAINGQRAGGLQPPTLLRAPPPARTPSHAIELQPMNRPLYSPASVRSVQPVQTPVPVARPIAEPRSATSSRTRDSLILAESHRNLALSSLCGEIPPVVDPDAPIENAVLLEHMRESQNGRPPKITPELISSIIDSDRTSRPVTVIAAPPQAALRRVPTENNLRSAINNTYTPFAPSLNTSSSLTPLLGDQAEHSQGSDQSSIFNDSSNQSGLGYLPSQHSEQFDLQVPTLRQLAREQKEREEKRAREEQEVKRKNRLARKESRRQINLATERRREVISRRAGAESYSEGPSAYTTPTMRAHANRAPTMNPPSYPSPGIHTPSTFTTPTEWTGISRLAPRPNPNALTQNRTFDTESTFTHSDDMNHSRQDVTSPASHGFPTSPPTYANPMSPVFDNPSSSIFASIFASPIRAYVPPSADITEQIELQTLPSTTYDDDEENSVFHRGRNGRNRNRRT